MYWLDGGHGGQKNTWITSRSLLETLTRMGELWFLYIFHNESNFLMLRNSLTLLLIIFNFIFKKIFRETFLIFFLNSRNQHSRPCNSLSSTRWQTSLDSKRRENFYRSVTQIGCFNYATHTFWNHNPKFGYPFRSITGFLPAHSYIATTALATATAKESKW